MKNISRPKILFFIFTVILSTISVIRIVNNISTLDRINISHAASQTFNSSGTWTAPAGIYLITVECWGGGGGGGGSTRRQANGGGGGGGGGYAKSTNISVTPGQSYQVTIGAGGTGGGQGANGGNGGSSSFNNNTVVASGGSGGGVGNATPGTAGAGGTNSTGDTTYNGGNGAAGTNPTGGGGGEGSGSTSNGNNANGSTGGSGTDGGDGGNGGASNTNGSAGTIPGGGGGGAGRGRTFRGYSGGAGGSGRCVISYTDIWAPSIGLATYDPTWSFSSNPTGVSADQIDMTATTGYDFTTPIMYLFTNDNSTCPTNHAGDGGTSSNWQTEATFSNTDLEPNSCYGYKVIAKDSAIPSNTGSASSIFYTYTAANTPGTPTLDNPTISTLVLMNNANDNPVLNPTTLFSAKVVYTSPGDTKWENKWIDSDGNPSNTEVWLSDSSMDGIVLQNLNENTEYGVSVKAKNNAGDETPLGPEGRGNTLGTGTPHEQTYVSSGTWIAPDNINMVDVECWGGGGGGGGSTRRQANGGGGGGGGGYAKSTNISVTPGQSYQVTIGAGGTGGGQGANGGNGGSSSFNNNTVVASGGSGGGVGNATPGTAGAGGTNSTGDTTYNGGNGAAGTNPTGGGGGEGSGSTSNGNNANGSTGGSGTDGGDGGNGGASNTNGSAGTIPGGGGGGAGRGATFRGYSGGNGSSGRCRISYKERITGTLSCKVTNSCPSGVVVYRMSDLINAHAELPNQNNYPNLVCCTGVPGLSNSCSGNYQTVLKLSATTNAHVEQNTQNNYPNDVCLQIPANGVIEIGYQQNNCNGYDTTIGSMSGITDAHVGDASAYPTKICATALVTGTITFNISNNNIGFGQLSVSNSRFATADGLGSNNETPAHTIEASTNGLNGYSIYIQGETLTGSPDTSIHINPIGNVSQPPMAGTEQFGIRATYSGGDGAVLAPYNDNVKYAYSASENTPAVLAVDLNGNDVSTMYSIYYLANISGNTEQSEYSTYITFTITGNF